MGRLVLNILLSFAQFERELIAEQTRDKMAAARRKGKWVGGLPPLGYTVDPRGPKLRVHEKEAERVRAIFALYLEQPALLRVVGELARRGWVTKRWQTRKGRWRGGRPFTKTSLYRLLTNVVYVGKIRYQKELHEAEHPGIIEPAVWQQVQELLQQHGPGRAKGPRSRCWALLRGLLYCRPCACRMTPTYASRNGRQRYRGVPDRSTLRKWVCTRRPMGPPRRTPPHKLNSVWRACARRRPRLARGVDGTDAPKAHPSSTIAFPVSSNPIDW
jgi:site-specific DNA recombinase